MSRREGTLLSGWCLTDCCDGCFFPTCPHKCHESEEARG